MSSITIGTSITGFPDAFNDQAAAIECDAMITAKVALAANVAARVGSLTTRSDDNTGVATLSTGHGIVNGKVDVYWAGGVRYGMDATVATNAVTVDGGAGDVLPAQDTAVTLTIPLDIDVNFDGDDMRVIAIVYRNPSDSTACAHGDFQDASHATIRELDLLVETSAGGLVRGENILNIAGGDTNDFAGNRVTHCHASHDSTSAGTLYIYCGYNT